MFPQTIAAHHSDTPCPQFVTFRSDCCKKIDEGQSNLLFKFINGIMSRVATHAKLCATAGLQFSTNIHISWNKTLSSSFQIHGATRHLCCLPRNYLRMMSISIPTHINYSHFNKLQQPIRCCDTITTDYTYHLF